VKINWHAAALDYTARPNDGDAISKNSAGDVWMMRSRALALGFDLGPAVKRPHPDKN